MKVIGTLLLSAALMVAMVSAQVCTQETCGDGPVWAFFSSDDCSGTPIFRKASVFDETCQGSVRGFMIEDGYTNIYYDNMDCDESSGSLVETYIFDICSVDNSLKRNEEHTMTASQRRQSAMKRETADSLALPSRMLLANVNATLPDPQPAFQYDASVARATESSEECYSADNCTLADGSPALYYENYFDSPNCTDFQYSEMMPKYQPGQCYNLYNATYVKVSCINEHSYQNVFYTNPSCSGTAFFYQQAYVLCSPDGSYQGHCSGPSEPIYGAPIAPTAEIPSEPTYGSPIAEIIPNNDPSTPTGNEASEPTSGAPVEENIPSNDPSTPTGNASSLHASVIMIFAATLAIFAF